MRVEHISVEKLKDMILKVLEKHLDLSKYDVFFFGSRVEGKGDERSDIDVGIEGKEPIPPHIIQKIKDEIEELPILYLIDIVDWKKVPEEFRRTAKKEYIHRATEKF